MEILIVNIVVAVVLLLLALVCRQSWGTRVACVLLLIAIPLYLTGNWIVGYRAVGGGPPSSDEIQNENVFGMERDRWIWLDGVHAMHWCTFERYVPKILPYLIALGILALTPYHQKKSQQKHEPDCS